MKINLSYERAIFTEAGSKVLTASQIAALINGNISSSAFSISSGETLSVICDLGSRYNLNQIVYYRSRATADTISIYGRQVSSESWSLLSSTSTSLSNTATIVSGTDRYRYIRVVHSVSSGSASAREIEIYTEDGDIDFGNLEQGQVGRYSVDSGTDSLLPQAVFVTNNDSINHDYYLLLDPSDPDSEDYGISLTSSGTFYPLFSGGVNFPQSYSWTSGSFINTGVVSNTVRITSGTSGVYYTPVVDLFGIEGRRVFWKSTVSGSNSIDATSRIDSLPTIEVRMSNTAPIGGWSSGQLSTDGNWSVVSGTLPFELITNQTILDPFSRRYFQARVSFSAAGAGQSPILERLGVEQGVKVSVAAGESAAVYIKSINNDNNRGKDTSLICFFYEQRDNL